MAQYHNVSLTKSLQYFLKIKNCYIQLQELIAIVIYNQKSTHFQFP